MRNLHQDAGPVTSARIASTGPAMDQVIQHLKSFAHNIVGFLPLDIDDKANSARVMLVVRIVKALALGNPAV